LYETDTLPFALYCPGEFLCYPPSWIVLEGYSHHQLLHLPQLLPAMFQIRI